MTPVMSLISAVISYLIKFLFLGAVAVGGVFLGKRIRVNKDAKIQAESIENK